jgi:hypothetical protein
MSTAQKRKTAPTGIPGYFTTDEVAAILAVNYRSVEHLVRIKKLKYGCDKFWCSGHGLDCPGHNGASRYFSLYALNQYKRKQQESAHV